MIKKNLKLIMSNPAWVRSFIFGLTLLAYSNIYGNHFTLDDHDYIERWELIRDWKNFPKFFWNYVPPEGQEGIYSPLKTVIHAVNYHLFGLNPIGHHVVAVINYLIIITLIYLIASRLLSQSAAFLATLFFALHPVHTEYVTNITGSVDAVGITWMFLAFWFYIRTDEKDESINRRRYGWAWVCAVVAIFTHELVIALPALFFWYDFVLRRPRLSTSSLTRRAIPFFVLVPVYIVLKHVVLGSVTRGGYLYDSVNLTALVTIKALAKYVLLCLFPFTLTHNHVISKGISSFDVSDFDPAAVLSQSWGDPQVVISIGLLAVLFYWAYTSFSKKPLVTFCVGWFFLSLLPVVNIVPNVVYFAERYIFVGTLGFCFLLGEFLSRFLEDSPENKRFYRNMVAYFIVVLFSFYLIRTWLRNMDWKNDVTLFESAVRTNPQSALMRTDLGVVYLRDGNLEKAMDSLTQSLQLKPDVPETHFILADVYSQKRMYGKAIKELKMAIELKKDYAEAYYNLAGIYAYWARADYAELYLKQALELWQEQGEKEKAEELGKSFREYLDKQVGEAERAHEGR